MSTPANQKPPSTFGKHQTLSDKLRSADYASLNCDQHLLLSCTPEEHLVMSVFGQAIKDIVHNEGAAEAREFLSLDCSDFVEYCDLLAVDAGIMLAGLLKRTRMVECNAQSVFISKAKLLKLAII